MSDIGDIRVTTTVDTSAAVTATEVLNRSILQLVSQINSFSVSAAKATSAFGSLERITADVGKQTKVVTGFIQAYGTAQNVTNLTIQNASKNLQVLDAQLTRVGSSNTKVTAGLRAQQAQFQAIAGSARELNRALTSASIQQWSQRSQSSLKLSTQSLLRTTAQTLAFTRALRTAFFSLADLEQQSVRVTKLLADNFGGGVKGIAAAAKQTEALGVELDKITRKFGTSRVLVQSIAGDFAELGISSNEAIAGLVRLTTTVEKLGNVDITQSQKFVETMLQNILRVRRDVRADQGLTLDLTNPAEFKEILFELEGQLAEFNYIENTTTLSLKDLADAFPEVSAAATTFGLSMTESAAMLVPMVAAGFRVGAAANSIKVSLQRMVAMTKQNTQIVAGLNQALGPDFDYAAGVSMANIQKLVNGFNTLRKTYGDQGSLELFARLFGVRQGPRMETSIRQAAVFQRALEESGSTERKIADSLQDSINARLEAAGKEVIQLKEIVDISNLHRAATERVNGEYTETAKIIREGQAEAFLDLNKKFAKLGTSGSDFIAKIGTEYGKVMLSSGFRIEDLAQEQLKLELELALDTTITRFRILKEEILAIGRVLVSAFDPIIKIMLKIAQPVRDFLQYMTEGTKKVLSFGVIFLALLPTIKLLSMSFRFFYASSIGGLARLISGFGKMGTKIISVTELIDRGDAALKGFTKAVQFSPDRILLSGRQRGAIADTAGLSQSLRESRAASGPAPTMGMIKSMLRKSVGLPGVSATMVGLAGGVGDTASVAADAAKAADGTLDAMRDGIGDALKTGFKGTVFQSNKFIGNTFGGRGGSGGPGSVGGRGGGSAPAGDGAPAREVRRVPRGPVYGPERPYGPFLPPSTTPVTGASGIPAGGFRVPTVAPAAPVVPKVKTPRGPKVTVGDIMVGRMPTIDRVKGVFGVALSNAAADAAAVATATGAAISGVAADVAATSTAAVDTIADGVGKVTTKTKAARATVGRAVGTGKKVAKMVELSGHEIAVAVRNAGQALPAEFAFLDNLEKTFLMTQKEKDAILKQVSEYAAAEKAAGRALSSKSGPLGTIKSTGRKGSKLFPSGTGRALAVPEKGGVKLRQATVAQDILAERLSRNKTPVREAQEIKNVIEDLAKSESKAVSDAVATARTGTTKGARKAVVKQAKAVQDALNKTVSNVESNLLKTAKYAGLVPDQGVEEVVERIPLITQQIVTKEEELNNVIRNLDKARLANNQALVQDLTIRRAAIEKQLIEMRGQQARVTRSRGALSKASMVEGTRIVEASPMAKQFGAVKESMMVGSQDAARMGNKGVTQKYLDKTIRQKFDDMSILMRGGAKGETVINKAIDAKAAYEAFVLDEIDKINAGIKKFDQDLINKLERIGYKINPKGEMAKASNRSAISRLARERVNVGSLDPAHPDYDPAEQKRVLGRSRIGQRVADARIQTVKDKVLLNPEFLNEADELERAGKEAQALKESLDKTSKQYTDDAVSKRKKLANTFKKQRAALLKNFGSVDKALESLATDVEKAAKLAPGTLATPSEVTRRAVAPKSLPTAAAVAASAAAPVVTSSGAGAVRTPTGVSRVFFSDAVKATTASVVGATKTIGSEVTRLLDDVLVKAIPAGFDPAKARVIRAVVAEVLAKTPITAASAATPAAQKFMGHVLGTMGDDVARVINSLAPQITEAISAGGISTKGGIVQSAKSKAVSAFNKFKGLATTAVVGNLAMLRTGIEAAVFDSLAAAGYAIESTTSSVAQALSAGTFSDDMLPGYLDELTNKRVGRSAAAVESGAKGGAAAAEGKAPALSREAKNAARRKSRAVERLMKERGVDAAAATSLYDEAVKSGDDAVKELLPDTRKKVKDAVGKVVEAPAKALTEASEAVGETVAEAKEEIVKSLDEAVDAATPSAPVSKPTPKSPVVPGAPATGPPRARTPREIIETRAPLDIRTSRVDEIKSMLKEAGAASPDIKALREAEVVAQKKVNKALENKAVFEKNVKDATDARKANYWQKQVTAADKELTSAKKSLDTATKKLDTEQAKLTRSMVKVKKSMDASAAKPAPAVGTPAAGAPAATPAGTARTPRVPGVSAPTVAPAAAVATSAIVEKLDDVIVEFDRSLANFFKGPNFFQGPNYFAGPLTVMPNAKFKDYKKSIKDATPSEKSERLRAQVERARAKRAGLAPDASAAASAPVAAAAGAAAAAKTGIMSKLGAALGSGLSKGASVGLKAVKAGFGVIGKSSAEFFKMSIAFLDIYSKALTGASSSSKMAAAATRSLGAAQRGLNAASAITAKVLNAAAAATLQFGRALAATTRGELAAFTASLARSKILKLWGFLLFTGMLPVLKGFKLLAIAAFNFRRTMDFSAIIAAFQTLYAQVLKTALSIVALVIKLNAAMLMIAPIVILLFSLFSKLKRGLSGMSPTMDNFKAAWVAIKDAIYVLAKPLEELILAFAGFNKVTTSTGRTAGVFYAISLAVRKMAEGFQRFAGTVKEPGNGLEYMNSVIVPIITRLINRFKLLGGAISKTFKGDTAGANKDFKLFLYSLLYELIAFVQKIAVVIAKGMELVAPSLGRIIDAVVAATILAFRKILQFTREVMLLIGLVIAGIGIATGNFAIGAGGAAMAASGAAFFLLDTKLKQFEDSARSGGMGAGKFIADGLVSGAKGAANGLDKLKGIVGKKYKDLYGKGINEAITGPLKDLPADVKKSIIKSAQDANAGGEGLGRQIAKGVKKGLQDLKEAFTDNMFGKADAEVDKFVEKLREGLDTQRDKALEAFDNQVEAIEALAEAEERLTAKIEYEEKRREMIRERALNKENYLRERKVAAYEGRSEDVRSLDLSFRKTSRDDDKGIEELDLDRARTLQAENRQNAIKVINKEKEKLIKEYEKMFKEFEDSIELIKARGFSTEDDFKKMFTNLQTAASGFSDDIAGAFEKSMLSLPAAIREHTDPSVGMFGMSMDKLVDEAKKSFGVGITSANSVSILGAAYSLVNGMPNAFKDAFNAGIISTYVTPFTTEVKDTLLTILPEDLWVKSAALAIQESVNEMKRKLVGLKGTLYDSMKELFGTLTEEDWGRIFGMSGAYADLESLKEYFTGLFPKAEDLVKTITTIETTRGQADSGGGEKTKARPGLTPSELAEGAGGAQFPMAPFGSALTGQKLQDLNALYDGEAVKKGFFGKLLDTMKGITDYLGPVKTAIAGFVGVVAGFFVAGKVFAIIKGLSIALGSAITAAMIIPVAIGSAVALAIYLYLRFKSVRDAVNGVAIAIWDFLVEGFKFSIGLVISIKDALINMWNASYPSLKKLYDFFVVGFGIIKDSMFKLVDILIMGPIKIIGSIFGGIIRIIGAGIGVLISLVGPPIGLIVKLVVGAIKIAIVAIIKSIEFIINVLDKIRDPLFKIIDVIFDIANAILGPVVNILRGAIDTIFNVIVGAINLVKAFIDGFWEAIMTGGRSLLPVLGPLILPVFDILKTVLGVVIDVLGNVFNFAKDVFGKLVDFIKVPFNWIKDNAGKALGPVSVAFETMKDVLSTVGSFLLTLVLAPFKLFFEVIKKIAQNPVVDFFLRLAAMLGLVAAILATWGVKIALESTWWVIKKVVGALVDLAKFIYDVVVKAFTFMKDLLVVAWNTIYSVVKKFVDWWRDNVGSLWLLLVAGFVIAYEVIKMVWSFLSDAFVKIWEVIRMVAAKYFDFVQAYVGIVLDVFKVLAGWLGTAFTAIWDVLKKAASLYWDYLSFALGMFWGVIKTVAGWLGTVFTVIWGVLKKAASLYWEYLKTAVSVWWSVIKTVAGWLGTAFTVIWGVIKKAASLCWDYLKTAVSVWWTVVKTVAGWLGTVFTAVWGGIKTAASAVWDYLQNIVPNTWDGLKKVSDWIVTIFTAAWGLLKDAVGFVWDLITTGLSFVYPALQLFADFVGTVLSLAWEGLKAYIQTVWDIIMFGWNIVSPILSVFADIVGPILGAAWDALKTAIGFVWDVFTFGWRFVGPILEFFANIIGNVIVGAWGVLKAGINFVWDAIKKGWALVSPILGFFGDIIKNVIGVAIDVVKAGWDIFIKAIKFAKDVAVKVFNAIGDTIGKVIGGAISVVITVWNGLKTAFSNVFDFIKPIIEKIGDFIRTVFGGAIDFVTGAIKAIPSAFKTILNSVAGLFNTIVEKLGNFAFPKDILGIPIPVIGGKKVSDFIRLPYLPTLYNGGKVGSYMQGGMTYMRGGMMYGAGGITQGPVQQAIPAILHGGEYVINNKAVQRIGTDTLDALNNMKLSKPRYPKMPNIPNVNMPNLKIDNSTMAQSPTGSSTQNVNIYVDTFVGEPEWFNSMMKDYNTRVLPRNQKAAGLQNRTISTYNGLNKGG
jgi:phage-related protein